MTAPSVPGSLEKGVRLFQGEGVSCVVYERMSAFFTFAALTPTPLSLREQCLSQRERGRSFELSTRPNPTHADYKARNKETPLARGFFQTVSRRNSNLARAGGFLPL